MASTDPQQLMRDAVALQQEGHYQDAIALIDEVIKLDPRRESAYNSKGLTWKMAGYPDEAIECYELNPLQPSPLGRDDGTGWKSNFLL